MNFKNERVQIVYEDSEILICRKPSGLAVQNASFGKPDLESMARTYLMEKYGKANPYLAVIHRLDQPVQGLVAFALTQKAAAFLSAQLQDGRMQKEYQAVVCGRLPEKSGTLVHYLKKEPAGNCSRAVQKGTPGAKRAELSYHVRKEQDGMALVKIQLKTGRHHQIRVQMAAVGAPLYGDAKYNPAVKMPAHKNAAHNPGEVRARPHSSAADGESVRQNAAQHHTETLALCADRLAFFHPTSGKKLEFTTVPEGFPME